MDRGGCLRTSVEAAVMAEERRQAEYRTEN